MSGGLTRRAGDSPPYLRRACEYLWCLLPFTPHLLILLLIIMNATSSLQRLWLAALCLLVTGATLRAEEVDWKSFGYGGSILTWQDRLDVIRSALSPLKTARRTFAAPMTVCALDLEMPSMLVLPDYPCPDCSFGSRALMILTSAQAMRRFQFDPSQHTGWITLADVQPPQVATEYHHVVIRMLRTYDAWKSEADARLLESLKGPGDAGFFALIEWELRRAGR